jgi:hypothetical protein
MFRPAFPSSAIISERSSPSRVRCAAPNNGAPLTAPDRSDNTFWTRGKGSCRTAYNAGGHFAAKMVPFFAATDKAPFAADARRALAQSLTPVQIAEEVKYLAGEGRNTFERPYGLAWLLQLIAELREWDDFEARQWSAWLRPLEQAATARIAAWLPKLDYPIRSGEHNNTAFALALMLDYARITGNAEFGRLLESRARDYYLKDRNCPLSYEPSGEDFLSPCLAEADVMRRILSPGEFVHWISGFLQRVDLEQVKPTRVSDVSDARLYHLAGLNISRAWMLEGILSKLPVADARHKRLAELASKLRQAGLESIKSEHYEGGHWLGSFAVYLVSGRGLS